jgi:hypothetical protein
MRGILLVGHPSSNEGAALDSHSDHCWDVSSLKDLAEKSGQVDGAEFSS